jgi:hypothetical protein
MASFPLHLHCTGRLPLFEVPTGDNGLAIPFATALVLSTICYVHLVDLPILFPAEPRPYAIFKSSLSQSYLSLPFLRSQMIIVSIVGHPLVSQFCHLLPAGRPARPAGPAHTLASSSTRRHPTPSLHKEPFLHPIPLTAPFFFLRTRRSSCLFVRTPGLQWGLENGNTPSGSRHAQKTTRRIGGERNRQKIMGYQRRSRVASGHRSWQKEHSKRLICSGRPLQFWCTPGFFARSAHRPLPRPGFVEEIPDNTYYWPTFMTPNSPNSWEHTGLKVKRETCTPETDYNGMVSHPLSGRLRLGHRTDSQADGRQPTLPASNIFLCRPLSCLTHHLSTDIRSTDAATSTRAHELPLGHSRSLFGPPNDLLHWPRLANATTVI